MIASPEEYDGPARVISVKMTTDMVTRLDEAAGRDREGRSGIVRRAIEEWLERNEDRVA